MRYINGKVLLLTGMSITALVAIIFCNFINPHLSIKCVGCIDIEPGNAEVYFEESDMIIRGFDKDGVTFFFFPSFINVDRIEQSGSLYKIYSMDGSEWERPLKNQIQDVLVRSPEGDTMPWKIGVFESENLQTMNILLDGIEFYEVDHDIYSEAKIEMYSMQGETVYYEDDALVKGRGNGSWPMDEMAIDEKRPFQIKLPEKVSFCRMKSSDKWVLIPNDDTGVRNKLAYDLADEIGMEYAIESDWVDLYVNNEYMGLYLICHEPCIGRNDLDIGNLTSFNQQYMGNSGIVEEENIRGYDYSLSDTLIPEGGYLIEKNMPVRYMRKRSGFKCRDDYFTVKSPWNASVDEVSYIRESVLQADDMIHGDIQGRLGMIDKYSFARQYLIAEISLNPDMAITSYYFYKKPNDKMLYAGPCWDYDEAFGEWSDCRNYTADINDIYQYREENGETPLDWDLCLLENDDYRNYVDEVFGKYTLVYEKLLLEGVDDYHDRIFRSLCMDHLRWNGNKNYETEIKNEYKYLKFFLYNRLKYLADSHDASVSLTEPDIYENTSHVLTFLYTDGTVAKMTVKDGAQVSADEMPQYDYSSYKGWRIFQNDTVHGFLTYYDPVFEDMNLVLE